MTKQTKKPAYRDEIFSMKEGETGWMAVGEWVGRVSERQGLSKKALFDRVREQLQLDEDPSKAKNFREVNFIYQIIKGDSKIPTRAIPAFCKAMGLSTLETRYHTAEILRVTLDKELEPWVITPWEAAKKEAREEITNRLIQERERDREESHKIFEEHKNNPNKFLPYKSHEDIDRYYDRIVRKIKEEAMRPPKSNIRAAFTVENSITGGHVDLQHSIDMAMRCDGLALEVFFNKDLKPVSDRVAIARLLRLFNAGNPNNKVEFEDAFRAMSYQASQDVDTQSLAFLSWRKSLDDFSSATEDMDQRLIDELLASETEIENPVEAACQYTLDRGLVKFERYYKPKEKDQKQWLADKNYFCENYIQWSHESGKFYEDSSLLTRHMTDEQNYDYWEDRSHEQYDYATVKRVETESGIGISGERPMGETYITHYFKKYLDQGRV